MKVFNLSCELGHSFEGWFRSEADFTTQREAALIACPLCGNSTVRRMLSAPRLNLGAVEPVLQKPQAPSAVVESIDPATMLRRIVHHLKQNSEDVGERFYEEARKIHYQESPERAIRGRASSEEVQELREEGIEILSIPGSLDHDTH